MPGNDLTALRNLVPSSSDRRDTARANIETVLDGILDDIEPKVTPSGMDMSSALSFLSGGTYSPITNLGYLNLQDRTATPAVNESVYIQADELYFRDGNGNDVQVTSGGSVNAGAGSINSSGSPAYGASGVELSWNATPEEYYFKAGSGAHDYADINVDRTRFSDGSTYYASLQAQAGMAASYDYYLPLTVPGSTSVMTMTSGGIMGNSRDLSVDTVACATFTASTDYLHSYNHTLYVSAVDGSSTASTSVDAAGEVTMGGSGILLCNVPLKQGDRITNIYAYVFGGDTSSKTVSLLTKSSCDGSAATTQASQASTTSGAHLISLTSINYTIASNAVFIAFNAASATDRVLGFRVQYDRS